MLCERVPGSLKLQVPLPWLRLHSKFVRPERNRKEEEGDKEIKATAYHDRQERVWMIKDIGATRPKTTGTVPDLERMSRVLP